MTKVQQMLKPSKARRHWVGTGNKPEMGAEGHRTPSLGQLVFMTGLLLSSVSSFFLHPLFSVTSWPTAWCPFQGRDSSENAATILSCLSY